MSSIQKKQRDFKKEYIFLLIKLNYSMM